MLNRLKRSLPSHFKCKIREIGQQIIGPGADKYELLEYMETLIQLQDQKIERLEARIAARIESLEKKLNQ